MRGDDGDEADEEEPNFLNVWSSGQGPLGHGMSGGLPLAYPSGRGHSVPRPEGRGRGRGRGPRKPPQWSGPLRPEPPAAGWFPTEVEEAFAASVRLPHGTSLPVDTGAPGKLAERH